MKSKKGITQIRNIAESDHREKGVVVSQEMCVEPIGSKKIMNILHIDDHALFADGLAYVLTNSSLNCDVHSAKNVAEVLKLLEGAHEFDLLLLDLFMPELDGLSLMREIINRNISIPVAIMSASDDPWKIKQALSMGAVAFLSKAMVADSLVEALEKVQRGEVFVPPEIEQALARLQQRNCKGDLSRRLQDLSISPRQYEVLTLIQQGLSNKNIGEALFVSESTIKSHIQVLFQALEGKNRVDCVRKAEALGILQK